MIVEILWVLALSAQGSSQPSSVTDLCSRITEIRILPFKGEHVDDPAYNALKGRSKEVVPCLIDRLTDVTLMPDPRQAPKYSRVTVGDVAFFLLVRFTGVSFEEMLPDEVREEYKKQGVYAYFEYVETASNRVSLQERWRAWLVGQDRTRCDD